MKQELVTSYFGSYWNIEAPELVEELPQLLRVAGTTTAQPVFHPYAPYDFYGAVRLSLSVPVRVTSTSLPNQLFVNKRTMVCWPKKLPFGKFYGIIGGQLPGRGTRVIDLAVGLRLRWTDAVVEPTLDCFRRSVLSLGFALNLPWYFTDDLPYSDW